jgi:hypothetical protein
MLIRSVALTAVLATLLATASLPAQPPPPMPLRPSSQYPYPGQPPIPQSGTVAVSRLYNPGNGDHFSTSDPGEVYGYLSSGSYQNEGSVFRLLTSAGPSLAPLYRLTTANGTFALGTMTVPGYVDPRGPIDKTLGYISITQRPGWVALYEWYNPEARFWFYTTDPRGEAAPAGGYRYVHVVGYVMPAS